MKPTIKPWKVKSIITQPIKVVVSTAATRSVGLLLRENEFVLSMSKTPFMDAQNRRRYVSLENDFDNEFFGLELGKVYNESVLEEIKVKKAEEDAKDYSKDK